MVPLDFSHSLLDQPEGDLQLRLVELTNRLQMNDSRTKMGRDPRRVILLHPGQLSNRHIQRPG
jgi:hypothetical protein